MHTGKYHSSLSLYSPHCQRLPLLHCTPEEGSEPDTHSGASVEGGPPQWRWSSGDAPRSLLGKMAGMTHWLASPWHSWRSTPPHPHCRHKDRNRNRNKKDPKLLMTQKSVLYKCGLFGHLVTVYLLKKFGFVCFTALIKGLCFKHVAFFEFFGFCRIKTQTFYIHCNWLVVLVITFILFYSTHLQKDDK